MQRENERERQRDRAAGPSTDALSADTKHSIAWFSNLIGCTLQQKRLLFGIILTLCLVECILYLYKIYTTYTRLNQKRQLDEHVHLSCSSLESITLYNTRMPQHSFRLRVIISQMCCYCLEYFIMILVFSVNV